MCDQVKIAGTQGQQPQLQDIIDGKDAVWTALPQEYAMWTLADQMARVAVGEWRRPTSGPTPSRRSTFDTPAAAAEEIIDNGWPGPDGFQDAFKELWGV